MKRRLFALALALLLAVSLPVSALAGEWFIDDGDIIISATENGQTVSQGNTTEADDAPVIKQRESSTTKTITINADENATANVTLGGVNIDASSRGNNTAGICTTGDGNVTIELDGNNSVKSAADAAGLQKNNSGNLTIKDDNTTAGNLEASGGRGSAGIGGGNNQRADNITITGGTIIAKGGGDGGSAYADGGGAGIGGGHYGGGSNITITGGDITAIGGGTGSNDYKYGGAGIGSGGNGGGGTKITISGGKVTANGGYAGAGIGGGYNSSGNNITISDGEVEATGGYLGAGIGGGNGSSGGGRAHDINISGGTVTANGGGGGAGIGGGNFASADNIAISGGEVTANGGDYAAGIGGGAQRSGSSIQISDGTVTAHGGYAGAGIGGGYASNGSDIKISGGEVKATGGEYAAGIGGGHDGNGSDIKLSGGEITAKGGTGGAGIGGGRSGTGSDITISGDAQVKSQGGTSNKNTGAGAGIGNGGTQVKNEDNKKVPVDGDEVEPDTSGLTENGRLEYYAPGADMKKDAPEKVIENKPEMGAQPGASAPVYSVTDKDGNAVSYTAAREGGVLTIRVDAAYARLTLTADEAQALTAQSVEKVIFVTTSATSAFRPADLTAYASEAPFVLTHDGETVTFTAGETDLASLLLQA